MEKGNNDKYLKRIGNLKLIDYIGSGGQTMGVLKGLIKLRNISTNSYEEIPCVAKSFALKQFRDKDFTKMYEREKEIGMKFSHPNLIKILGEIKSKTTTYLIMEYAYGGDLKSFLEYYKYNITDEIIKIFLQQILNGIFHLHSNNIMHRDIKLENVLLHFYDQDIFYIKDNKGKLRIAYDKQDYAKCQLKICDFGFSKDFSNTSPIISSNLHTVLGTQQYMSKEIDTGDYDETCDFWALGILVLMLLGIHTDENIKDMSVIEINKGIKISLELRQVLDFLLKNDSCERESCKNLFELEFFIKSSLTMVNYEDLTDCKERDSLFQIDLKNHTKYKEIFNSIKK